MTPAISARLTAALLVAFASAPGLSQPAAPLAALSALEPGLWQLKADGEAPQNICLADPDVLVQLRHRGGACSRTIVANDKTEATVHYSCAGAGWGRTSVRVVSSRAAMVDTQGIAANAPFAFVADARRIGDCPARSAAVAR